MTREKACQGGQTLDNCGDMRECLHCGREVRWDMVDHPFWGFAAACEETTPRKTAQPNSSTVTPESAS